MSKEIYSRNHCLLNSLLRHWLFLFLNDRLLLSKGNWFLNIRLFTDWLLKSFLSFLLFLYFFFSLNNWLHFFFIIISWFSVSPLFVMFLRIGRPLLALRRKWLWFIRIWSRVAMGFFGFWLVFLSWMMMPWKLRRFLWIFSFVMMLSRNHF